jgi:hypothetical protein
MSWFSDNYKWLFDGVGGAVALALVGFVFHRWFQSKQEQGGQVAQTTLKVEDSSVTNSPVAAGSNITQTVNSPTVNVTLPAPPSSPAGREKYEEWRELIRELHESFIQIGYAFLPLNAITPGVEDNDYQAGIRRGYRVIRSRIFIAETLKKEGVLEKYEEIVRYAISATCPREPSQRGCPTMNGFDLKAGAFQDELMQIARKDMGVLQALARNEDAPRCDFWLEFEDSNSEYRPLRIQNNGDGPAFDVMVRIPADGSGFKSDLINRLNNDKTWAPCTSNGNPENLKSLRLTIVSALLNGSNEGADAKSIPVLITYRDHARRDCECHLEIRLGLRNGIQFALPGAI